MGTLAKTEERLRVRTMWVDDAYFLPFAVAVFSLIVSVVILVECKSKRFKNFFGKRQYPPDVIAQITITEKRIKKVAYVLLFVAVIHLPLLFFSIIEGTALVFSFGWLGIDLFALGLMTYTFSLLVQVNCDGNECIKQKR